jgi:hypothetical protein
MWSSKGLQPYLAITAHWLGRKGEQVTLRQALLAFRRVRGSHSGERLSRIIFQIYEQAGIIDKVAEFILFFFLPRLNAYALQMGHFTMDNASNNNTFMSYLAMLLAEKGVLDFDTEENYIRCFSHVINLCSQAVIRAMEKQDSRDDHPETETETESDEDTGCAVRTRRRAGPIRRARKTVAFIRKSGQRRDEFLETIKLGNEKQSWTEIRDDHGVLMRVIVQLSEVTVLPDDRPGIGAPGHLFKSARVATYYNVLHYITTSSHKS